MVLQNKVYPATAVFRGYILESHAHCWCFFVIYPAEQKPLAMRIRMSYKVNGEDRLEQGQVNNFPSGL